MRNARVRAWALVAVAAAGLAGGAGADEAVGRRIPDEGAGHVPEGTRVRYRHQPPTSGAHWPRPAPWGVYDDPIPPERYVHNLAHGGVVILYHCPAACPRLVEQLQDAYAGFPKSKYDTVKLVIAPDPSLKSRLALLAWDWIDELPDFDRAEILRFYESRVDQGPEDVP